MEKKKTFKEFVKEHRALIGYTVGVAVGVGVMYFYSKDAIKLSKLLNEYTPSSDGVMLSDRVYQFASPSSYVVPIAAVKPKTFKDLHEAVDLIINEATANGHVNDSITGMLVFSKK